MIIELERHDSPHAAVWWIGAANSGEARAADKELLDQLIHSWSAILTLVLGQDALPEEVRCDWRTCLVDLNFLDPRVRGLLDTLSTEMQRWGHRLSCDAVQLVARLHELSQLCIEYQRSSR